MSRRANPTQAAQNQQTIKSLLKLESNKICADCKRNKHPRWASWNLGIFICIRCSGIHRGMGTHISRVKSVDLDAWTDEQLQSVLKWGNSRANKYWEAKLAPGHVPAEAKIENFIRTKYDSKRWVMDGGMPDPSTLDDGDDVPLAVVQQQAKIERSASQRVTSPNQPAVRRQQPSIDLFGDDPIAPPVRPSTTEPAARAQPRQAPPAQPKPQKPGDSLLGLDFFGSTQAAAGSRPTSTASTPAAPSGMSRPDLKQSILSLYSKPQPPPPTQHERNNSFGDMASPTGASASSNMGGLTDAFSGLSFPSSTTSPPPRPAEKPAPFANLSNFGNVKSMPATPKVTSPSDSAGGDLFGSLTSPTMSATKPQSRTTSISSNGQDHGFGGFGGFASPPAKPNPPSIPLSNDLFGLSSPPPAPAAVSSPPPQPKAPSPQQEMKSAFNLSSPVMQPSAPPIQTAATKAPASMFPASIDPWGGNAWNTPDPAPEPAPAPAAAPSAASMMKVPDTLTANDIGSGWGAPSKQTPTVTADEDFGGWTSAAPVSSNTMTATSNVSSSTKPAGGFGGNDDLFSNVWE
ncbi:Arf GTPase activating protein [Penicillium riverlandense]|uniref:Arf GTPase activating protein n=1 Tax=Penicillium riverlandense TaxID=1903569 RepID=UPI002546889E|nr:Arf GTPase activating protein [Penicillium riverlandense]KAJ5825664.1 Arf GTPase activating protein [Penicillium riverlandense]